MISFFRLSQRRTPAAIALLAILMLFIAPVVSKTLEHYREGIKNEINHCMPMSDMQNNNSHHQASSPTHTMGHHGVAHIHMGLLDDIACGYCQLLIDLPLLGGFVSCVLLTLRAPQEPPASRFSGPIIRLFYGESQPRAPPLMSLFT
ncbi:DUF2946 domain-containing protein [Xenorhabdus kozodoii]|uniref:DUF2946 domain-containing protein n=1 Tax=Xenorhabdus kozodoii TaxID=351676 RepID=A0A2D0LEU1_9GAMM|nr:DUF2946 domain-containing protein [Xenorhabdus kozodoii]PHM74224.1 hypothetical protein Xkoz_01110 [Xenorhabdus kozodoii]